MNKNLKTIILTAVISLSICLGTNAAVKSVKPHSKCPVNVQNTVAQSSSASELTDPLDIVKNPNKYLNKKVTIKAEFDKFSTLGLDYKPAFKSSEKYIGFLIKRSDVTGHTIPLSELKNFLDRKVAEKYIDLKPGDEVQYTGVVFSDALSDAWLEVTDFNVLTAKPEAGAAGKNGTADKATDKK